ncbi:MAG: winged helix-turn-helix domain-containing protein [Jatrophihabitantaceae bacterium]
MQSEPAESSATPGVAGRLMSSQPDPAILHVMPPDQIVSSSSHIYVVDDGDGDTDRAVLRTMHRCGVKGELAVRTLVVVDQFLDALRIAGVTNRVELQVAASPSTVRMELTFAQAANEAYALRRGLSRKSSTVIDANARRWAIAREGRRTSFTAEIDRVGRAPATPQVARAAATLAGHARDIDEVEPIAALLDLTAELSHARNTSEVHRVVTRSLRERLGASFTGIALRAGGQMRFVSLEPFSAETVARWRAFPVTATIPIATSCLAAKAYLHANPDIADAEFPGMGAEMRAAGTQAMASLPMIAGGRSIGTLVFAWPRPRRLDALEPFLRIVAGHVAQATYRITSGGGSAGAPLLGGDAANTPPAASQDEVGPVRLDLVSRLAHVRGRAVPIRLTGREFELLLHLMRNAGVPQDRHGLLREVWGIDFAAGTSVVDVTMSRLRRKLGIHQIETVKDLGYVFRV